MHAWLQCHLHFTPPTPSYLLLINYLLSVEMLINYFPLLFLTVFDCLFQVLISTACFGCLFQLLPIAVSDEGLGHKYSHCR